jgi:hypothetical protein
LAIIDLSSVVVATGLVMVSDTRISRIHFGWMTNGASRGSSHQAERRNRPAPMPAHGRDIAITSSVAAPAAEGMTDDDGGRDLERAEHVVDTGSLIPGRV